MAPGIAQRVAVVVQDLDSAIRLDGVAGPAIIDGLLPPVALPSLSKESTTMSWPGFALRLEITITVPSVFSTALPGPETTRSEPTCTGSFMMNLMVPPRRPFGRKMIPPVSDFLMRTTVTVSMVLPFASFTMKIAVPPWASLAPGMNTFSPVFGPW